MSKLKTFLSIFTKGKNVTSQNEAPSSETSLPENSNAEMETKEVEVEWHENTTEF